MVITTNQAKDYYDSLRQKMSHDFVWYSQVQSLNVFEQFSHAENVISRNLT